MKKANVLLILTLITVMTSCGSVNGSLPEGETPSNTPSTLTSNYNGTYYQKVNFNLTKAELKTSLFNVISKGTKTSRLSSGRSSR